MLPYIALGPRQRVSADPAMSLPVLARAGAIGPDYFTTLGVRMRAGRSFSREDTAAREPVAIVNDILAAQLWAVQGADSLGAVLGRQVWIEGRAHSSCCAPTATRRRSRKSCGASLPRSAAV